MSDSRSDEPGDAKWRDVDEQMRLAEAQKQDVAKNQVSRELAERAKARPATILMRHLINSNVRFAGAVRQESAVSSLNAWKSLKYRKATAFSTEIAATPRARPRAVPATLLLADEAARMVWGIGYILATRDKRDFDFVDPVADLLVVLCQMAAKDEDRLDYAVMPVPTQVAASKFASIVVSQLLKADVDLHEVIKAVAEGGDGAQAVPEALCQALNRFSTAAPTTGAGGVGMLGLLPLVGGVVQVVAAAVLLRRIAAAAESYYRAKLRLALPSPIISKTSITDETKRIIESKSVAELLSTRVAISPDARAFAAPNAADTAIEWITWKQVGERVYAVAAGLIGLGVGLEDSVAILSSTRIEWILADLGINCAGAATTTVHPATDPDDAAYIMADSGSKVLIAENPQQAGKLSRARTSVTHVVLVDGTADASAQPPQLTLAELEERGNAALRQNPDLIKRVAATVGPDHVATLIYTSGTTGRPKGVQLLHGGWIWQGAAQAGLGLVEPNDLQYLWLPLSHSFGKSLLCGTLHVGVPTYVDGRVDMLVDMLSVVKPTLLCATPRIFEKVYNQTVTTALSAGRAKAKTFGWALATGRQKVALEQASKPVDTALKAKYALAEKLVFSKLRQRLGGRLRVLVSGSAPLSRDIAEFFAAGNLPILESYGLNETSGAVLVNRPSGFKIGTVGQPLSDLECRIDTDGEVLLRGKPVMRGYHNLPQDTDEAFTPDGFFRTGDIGELDSDGYLTITDREKDLLKTSGGKYIAPSAIEGMFRAVCPYTSQAVVVGQARNYVTMLISLDEDAIAGWAAGGPLADKSYEEIVTAPETQKLIAGYINELNGKLNRWETIKKFTILPRDLSIEAGEITPSMKIKRRSVETNFAAQIDTMYAEAGVTEGSNSRRH